MSSLKLPPPGMVKNIRLRAEKEGYQKLLDDKAIGKIADDIIKQSEYDSHHRRLLASGLRISKRIIPSLMELVDAAKKITGFERPVEVYVYDNPLQNACCTDFGDRQVFLLFSSGIIEKMKNHELLFVIGHEFGHAIYEHHSIPVLAMIKAGDRLEPQQTLSLMSWSRRAEISADRVGLLCCQNFNAASVALIKLSCGLTEKSIQFDVEEYAKQMQDIQELSDLVQDVDDWFSTHPFSPLRVLAINYFWLSQDMRGLLGISSEKVISREDADKRIAGLLESMEPTTPEAEEQNEAECLLWGCLLIASSDGRIDIEEMKSIEDMIPADMFASAKNEISSTPNFTALFQKRFDHAAKRARSLSATKRHILIQKLISLARADMRVEESEKATLRNICQKLGLSSSFADQMLIMTE